MINKLGFMQGRLSPIYNKQIQSFPYQNWENEFDQAKKLSFNHIEWTVDQFIPEIYSAFKEGVSNPFQYGKSLYPRAARGGSWMDKPEKLRAAHRIASSTVAPSPYRLATKEPR